MLHVDIGNRLLTDNKDDKADYNNMLPSERRVWLRTSYICKQFDNTASLLVHGGNDLMMRLCIF
jgi:hypothetical protein